MCLFLFCLVFLLQLQKFQQTVNIIQDHISTLNLHNFIISLFLITKKMQ